MELRKLVLRQGEVVTCELHAVVRNHHGAMPGADRARPGWDRVQIRTPDGEDIVVDLWSTAGQDLALATPQLELYEVSDMLRWRAHEAPVVAAQGAGGEAAAAAGSEGDAARRHVRHVVVPAADPASSAGAVAESAGARPSVASTEPTAAAGPNGAPRKDSA